MIFTRKSGEKLVVFRAGDTLSKIEQEIYTVLWEKYRRCRRKVAAELGVSYRTVSLKVKTYGLPKYWDRYNARR